MTTIAALISSRGPDAARLHGLRGRFFLSGPAAVFYEMRGETSRGAGVAPLPADSFTHSVHAVEWLARRLEDAGWEVQRRAILGFTVLGRAWEGREPDPWDQAWLDREARLEAARKKWDADHGVHAAAVDERREGALRRHRAARWTEGDEERAERERAEAEASDG